MSSGCIQFNLCPYKKGMFHTETGMPRGKMMWRASEGRQLSSSQRKKPGQGSSEPSEGANPETPWDELSALQKYEAIKFCCLSHLVCVILFGSPS